MNINHTTRIPVTRANRLVFPEAYRQHFCATPKRKFTACLKIKKYFLNKKPWWKPTLAAPPFPSHYFKWSADLNSSPMAQKQGGYLINAAGHLELTSYKLSQIKYRPSSTQKDNSILYALLKIQSLVKYIIPHSSQPNTYEENTHLLVYYR